VAGLQRLCQAALPAIDLLSLGKRILELGCGRCLTLIGVGSDAVGHALRNAEGDRSALLFPPAARRGTEAVIDPTQAPPGKHTTYCWHVMPLAPDLGGQDYEAFKREFAEKIIATFARYCPNLTRDNIIGQYVYTAKEYTQELINMRHGDIFLGAFNAEQVMYNHTVLRRASLIR
jgi:phytoene dehydrogenase-like protein